MPTIRNLQTSGTNIAGMRKFFQKKKKNISDSFQQNAYDSFVEKKKITNANIIFKNDDDVQNKTKWFLK